jgi:hypothetical protein
LKSSALKKPSGRRGSFTRASAGETLDDVALRVYGSADAVHTLWTANRDVLSSPVGSLDAGTVLRTP